MDNKSEMEGSPFTPKNMQEKRINSLFWVSRQLTVRNLSEFISSCKGKSGVKFERISHFQGNVNMVRAWGIFMVT